MATATRTTATLRNSRCGQASFIALVALANLLASGAIAAASPNCGADFLFPPSENLRFFYLDTVDVAYRSHFTHPSLSCWCGAPGSATQS